MVFETRLTTCTKRNRGEESAAFLPTPPHVHSVTIRSPVRLSPTFARNFDLNLFKDCITRGRFSFLQRSCFARDYERNQDVAMRASIDVQWNFPLTDSRHPFSFPPLYPSFFSLFFSFLYRNHTRIWGGPSFAYEIFVYAVNEIQVNWNEIPLNYFQVRIMDIKITIRLFYKCHVLYILRSKWENIYLLYHM